MTNIADFSRSFKFWLIPFGKKYMKSPKGDIYTNNPKGKNVIEEKYFFQKYIYYTSG